MFCVDTLGSVQIIEKSQPAPYSGLIFTVEKANELRRVWMDRDACQIMETAEHKELETLRNHSDFNKVLFFIGGALAGALTIYAVKTITN